MVLDGNVPLQWAWMDEAQEFCDTYQKNEESGTKELMDMVAELIIKYDRENNIVWGSEELPENCDYLYDKNPNICIFFNYPDVFLGVIAMSCMGFTFFFVFSQNLISG